MWKILIPWEISRQHTAVPYQFHCIPVIISNRRHNETDASTIRLNSNSGGISNYIQCKRHETCRPQQRKLLKRTTTKKPSRRTFFLVKRVNNTTKQWGSVEHITYNKKLYDIDNRSRANSTLHNGKRGSVHYNNSRGTRTQATPHTTTNRQLNSRHSLQWESTPQKGKSHGHEIPLDQRQIMTATIQNILETR